VDSLIVHSILSYVEGRCPGCCCRVEEPRICQCLYKIAIRGNRSNVLYPVVSETLFWIEIYTLAFPSFAVWRKEIIKNKTLTMTKVTLIGVIMGPHYSFNPLCR
jgi:hypothetical protein